MTNARFEGRRVCYRLPTTGYLPSVTRSDAELLARFEADVFAALGHDAARGRAAADDGADGRALTAARDGADDGADGRRAADLRHVPLRRVVAPHAALLADLADARRFGL